MSFRLFIYYCALCGGGGAFVGWAVGRALSSGVRNETLQAGLRGLSLGLAVALALGLVDAWSQGLNQPFTALLRVLTAVVVGTLGGFVGAALGQSLYSRYDRESFLVCGWCLVGVLVGAALGVFDLLVAASRNEDTQPALRKLRNAVLGGGVGGILGGMLYLMLQSGLLGLFVRQDPKAQWDTKAFWSPSAWGLVALGACIGLLIALAQVILKEAWLKVEKGFRAGREQMLVKPEVTIGKAEGCDVGLFGDPLIERLHARIRKQGQQYVLTDAGSASGTYVNEQRVVGPVVLRSGDVIRLGRAVLRFGERAKQ